MAFNPDYFHLSEEYGGPVGRKEWTYETLEAVGAVDADDYFTDVKKLGVEVGDLIYCRIWTTAIPANNAAKYTAVLADAARFVVTSFAGTAATVAAETALVVAESG